MPKAHALFFSSGDRSLTHLSGLNPHQIAFIERWQVHNAAYQLMPDAIHPKPAPSMPQNGPTTNILAIAVRAPIPHAAWFGPSEAM